jgi:hypothetical protein
MKDTIQGVSKLQSHSDIRFEDMLTIIIAKGDIRYVASPHFDTSSISL